ncbi:MAG TPA: hypothetical protein PLL20_11550 [Phycisphaerae bacterium]|nr:hypothetical protein [Phycisphaerae bacterium]HRR86504.1 hypothetical protein [Phycisphaerae bacterium]
MMHAKGRRLAPVLVFAMLAGASGYIWWLTSPREFRGKLLHGPGMAGIPEDPPPLAYLVMADGSHELDIPRHMADRDFRRRLMEMDGKQVIVRGKRAIRRTMLRRHRAIRVLDLRLCE